MADCCQHAHAALTPAGLPARLGRSLATVHTLVRWNMFGVLRLTCSGIQASLHKYDPSAPATGATSALAQEHAPSSVWRSAERPNIVGEWIVGKVRH
jgi:hypothetical protein